jgi:hypothetical protein
MDKANSTFHGSVSCKEPSTTLSEQVTPPFSPVDTVVFQLVSTTLPNASVGVTSKYYLEEFCTEKEKNRAISDPDAYLMAVYNAKTYQQQLWQPQQ